MTTCEHGIESAPSENSCIAFFLTKAFTFFSALSVNLKLVWDHLNYKCVLKEVSGC